MKALWKHKNKPKGMYKGDLPDNVCSVCSYLNETERYCGVGHKDVANPDKQKCADFLNERAGIPDEPANT